MRDLLPLSVFTLFQKLFSLWLPYVFVTMVQQNWFSGIGLNEYAHIPVVMVQSLDHAAEKI